MSYDNSLRFYLDKFCVGNINDCGDCKTTFKTRVLLSVHKRCGEILITSTPVSLKSTAGEYLENLLQNEKNLASLVCRLAIGGFVQESSLDFEEDESLNLVIDDYVLPALKQINL